jgi:hypothetical protein
MPTCQGLNYFLRALAPGTLPGQAGSSVPVTAVSSINSPPRVVPAIAAAKTHRIRIDATPRTPASTRRRYADAANPRTASFTCTVSNTSDGTSQSSRNRLMAQWSCSSSAKTSSDLRHAACCWPLISPRYTVRRMVLEQGRRRFHHVEGGVLPSSYLPVLRRNMEAAECQKSSRKRRQSG